MWSRRRVLGAGLGALVVPVARAASSGRPVIFAHAPGGWDPTLTFAPLFDDPAVDMDGGEADQLGDIPYVRHRLRPSVDRFLGTWSDRTRVFLGLEIGSLSHDLGRRLVCTGSHGDEPDWATRIAAAGPALPLPHLVLGGPAYAGELGAWVARSGADGQLAELVDGSVLARSDHPSQPQGLDATELVDAHLALRAEALAARANPERQDLLTSYTQGLDGAATLRTLADRLQWDTSTFSGQIDAALRALELGLSRCVTLDWPGLGTLAWDTHVDNAAQQSSLWEGLFAALDELVERVELSGTDALVVVLSEMGRAPRENGEGGKDHWPVSTCFVVGAGVAGGTVGGWASGLLGAGVDGDPLTPTRVGEELLGLALS